MVAPTRYNVSKTERLQGFRWGARQHQAPDGDGWTEFEA